MMNCEEHPHLTTAMAMRLGIALKFGDHQTADVVLKLTSSAVSSGTGVSVGSNDGFFETSVSSHNDGSSTQARAAGVGGLRLGDAKMEVAIEDGGSGDEQKEMEVVETLCLHSKALQRSELFEACLSEQRTSFPKKSSSTGLGVGVGGGTIPHPEVVHLIVRDCKDPETFLRCIRFMYVPQNIQHKCLTSIEDALNILEVAVKLVFQDCVTACMRYLESLPWSHNDESAIRACISKLQLQLSDDLAARLSSPETVPNGKPVEIMQDVLGELLTVVTSGGEGQGDKAERITRSLLHANVQPASSWPEFALVNETGLLNEFSVNLEILKIQLRNFAGSLVWDKHQVHVACRALEWLSIELLTLEIADDLVRMFSEEKELAELMVSKTYENPFTSTLFVTLLRILQALQGGDVSSPLSVRLALLTTWLPVIAKLGYENDYLAHKDHYLEEGLGAVVKTLPNRDQKLIFSIWIKECMKGSRTWPDLSDAFESWCSHLRSSYTD